jgi:hypothetical protein
MKVFLLYVSFIILLISCKNEPMLYDVGKGLDIAEIKTDFIRKTGYRQSDSSFINPSFKSVVDWNTFYEVGMDTLYVKVNVADRLEISVSESKRILLNDNIWIRGTKKNDKWQYSVLTFIPSSNTQEYSGIIISKSLQSGTQNISFYEANAKVPFQLVKRAGKAPAMPTDCIYGYVNGALNEISCSGGSGDDDGTDDPPYSGDPRDYQNFPPSGGGAGGTGGDGTVPTYTEVPTEEQLEEQLKDKPFALFGDLDCNFLKQWLDVVKYKVQQSQIDKLSQISASPQIAPWLNSAIKARVQDINNASGVAVNLDYFSVSVTKLPTVNGAILTPEQTLQYIRKNLNNFVDNSYAKFEPYKWFGVNDESLWNSSNPLNSVMGIRIGTGSFLSPAITVDDGSVIVSDFRSNKWIFSTIYDPKYGVHPVSGNREFGFSTSFVGSVPVYTFYTRGADRLTKPIHTLGNIGFEKADELWKSFQNKLSTFINGSNGIAIVNTPVIQRPNWNIIKHVIDGKLPLSTLSTDCP